MAVCKWRVAVGYRGATDGLDMSVVAVGVAIAIAIGVALVTRTFALDHVAPAGIIHQRAWSPWRAEECSRARARQGDVDACLLWRDWYDDFGHGGGLSGGVVV